MRKIVLSGLALGAVSLAAPATAASGDTILPIAGLASVAMSGGYRAMPVRHSWGHSFGGRWHGGWAAPGGWHAWRLPVFGFILPRYWIQPVFYIADYSRYGLRVPGYGYGWSRYYDDAVLTDRYGRVHDYRNDVRWDGDDTKTAGKPVYRDAPPPQLPFYDDGSYGDHGVVTYGGDRDDAGYRGTWTGTWTGEDGRTYSGTYSGAYHDEAEMHDAPHWRGDGPPHAAPMLPYQGGYYADGYYYPAPVVTTVVVHPSATTTTTTFIEEEVVHRAPARTWKPKKTWAPRKSVKATPKRTCACK